MSEEVVLLSDEGTPIGTASKATVHSAETPLHLAFSCYVLNRSGQLLVTRRALGKATWPGVWTNSFCGHPLPAESFESAIARRAEAELGLQLSNLRLVLPEFRYRAVDDSGIVEHEICPVFVAEATGEPLLNPNEAMACDWVDPEALYAAVSAAPQLVSPWMAEQVPLLRAAGALGLGS